MKKTFLGLGLMMLFIGTSPTLAQFSLDGQIIQRGEYRNGYNRLIPDSQQAAMFIAQRARLQASYQVEYFSFYMSIQDIRTWGNTSQVKATDGFLSVHEAWAMASLSKNWKIKLGRQELNYDNFRFLGNLDWALQGRAHDFALVKFEKGQTKLDFGGGFNQDAQNLTGTLFTIPNQYKVAQFARLENKWEKLHVSLLFWNDGRQLVQRDDTGNVVSQTTHFRQTLGLPTIQFTNKNTQFSSYYYHQLGKDPSGKSVNAYNFSLNLKQTFVIDQELGKSWVLSLGMEHLSGTSPDNLTNNNSFNPLYGTNHLFNGYMDLFFVGETNNTAGLEDYYFRSRYNLNKNFFLQGDIHVFHAQNSLIQFEDNNQIALNPYLGTELDFTFGYIVNDAFSIQSGYSQFFKTDSFTSIQPNQDLNSAQNWAYLMLIFRPTMKNKFIGILL